MSAIKTSKEEKPLIIDPQTKQLLIKSFQEDKLRIDVVFSILEYSVRNKSKLTEILEWSMKIKPDYHECFVNNLRYGVEEGYKKTVELIEEEKERKKFLLQVRQKVKEGAYSFQLASGAKVVVTSNEKRKYSGHIEVHNDKIDFETNATGLWVLKRWNNLLFLTFTWHGKPISTQMWNAIETAITKNMPVNLTFLFE
ncbi:MAG: hypothetical protein NWF09_07510 [Candidatus Bathyarchaeota archaeon]|nr:hypothetical protein [Candidatus Bathyarchaeota archaeon]